MHMLRSLLVAGLPLVAAASSVPQLLQTRASEEHCAIQGAPKGLVRTIVELGNKDSLVKTLGNHDSNIKVTVHMHVAQANKTTYATDKVLKQQFNVLKDALNIQADQFQPYQDAKYGIDFELGSIHREINKTIALFSDWRLDDEDFGIIGTDAAHEDYLKRTKIGTRDTLNVYYYDTIERTAAFCNIANPDRPKSMDWLDGCQLNINTLPGGTAANRGYGISLIHEVGHWFGLLHVFQGGCEGEGDYIDDTPASLVTSADGKCHEGKDTCPDLPGLDPIHNYMDYTTDPCRNTFTKDQKKRMHDIFWAVRSGN
ncbi:hypothetical protein FSARC_13100 [Fusarium sarcochroum]|uniref:Peptidase M43 pregnancy-associated plasma-A domain-containing protein n=1 Tax=Fusarium sarcochroum TaxID=1208366 RepID=A0A8H4T3R6_9HYPO|nr:hypothetical protein FSARC_13100 [Fusarium sarcochroum]